MPLLDIEKPLELPAPSTFTPPGLEVEVLDYWERQRQLDRMLIKLRRIQIDFYNAYPAHLRVLTQGGR